MHRELLSPACLQQLTRYIELVFRAINAIDSEDLGYSNSLSADEGINQVLSSLGEVASNHGIRFPRSFTLLLKQFLYFDRYVQILAPGANLFDDERMIIDL
jgi:aarF domain-containing kinase